MEKTELDFTPYRLKNESYEDYKNRRKVCKLFEKRRVKGYLFWDSSKRGTYTKELGTKLLQDV